MPWYRVIKDINYELANLRMRESLKPNELSSQQPRCSTENEVVPNDFTYMSSFQYIVAKVKQHVFNSYNCDNAFGVILKVNTDKPRKVFWRKNDRCELSNDIFKVPMSEDEFSKKLKEKSFSLVNEKKVAGLVLEKFNKLKNNYRNENLDEDDANLPWTEGVFRYKANEVDGIVVNATNQKSCRDGLKFKNFIFSVTGKSPKFYYYDAFDSKFKIISEAEVKRRALNNIKDRNKLCASPTSNKPNTNMTEFAQRLIYGRCKHERAFR